MFNIDFDRLILWFIPAHRRRVVLYAWLRVLCTPVKVLYDRLLVQRDADLYNLAHDSRVFSLRAMLNDRFDTQLRRIYLTDGFTKQRIYIYTRQENKPQTLPIALYNRGDYADTGVDFIVWVPLGVPLTAQDLIELVAKTNYYKLAGKRFSIYRK